MERRFTKPEISDRFRLCTTKVTSVKENLSLNEPGSCLAVDEQNSVGGTIWKIQPSEGSLSRFRWPDS
jgi:hypothetical protein